MDETALPRSHPNPAIGISPQLAHRAVMGKLARPHYAPVPVGPSRAEIQHAKVQLVGHRIALSRADTHIARIEAALDRADPQRVIACAVPGYVDPPERVERAAADKAAGVVSIITAEHAAKIMAGEVPPPNLGGPHYSQIHEAKLRILHFREMAAHVEGHSAYLEYDLDGLDPQRVVAVKVGDYQDPPERTALAAKLAAAGQAPAEHEGM